MREEYGSRAALVWQFEPPVRSFPKKVTGTTLARVSKTPESIALSKNLKEQGWSFIGPITMYTFIQAAGIVNDHLAGCAMRQPCAEARAEFDVPLPKGFEEGRRQ